VRSSNFSQRQPGLSATSQDQRAKINDPVDKLLLNNIRSGREVLCAVCVPCVSRLPPVSLNRHGDWSLWNVPEILFA